MDSPLEKSRAATCAECHAYVSCAWRESPELLADQQMTCPLGRWEIAPASAPPAAN